MGKCHVKQEFRIRTTDTVTDPFFGFRVPLAFGDGFCAVISESR